jgi:hypothetical protein
LARWYIRLHLGHVDIVDVLYLASPAGLKWTFRHSGPVSAYLYPASGVGRGVLLLFPSLSSALNVYVIEGLTFNAGRVVLCFPFFLFGAGDLVLVLTCERLQPSMVHENIALVQRPSW